MLLDAVATTVLTPALDRWRGNRSASFRRKVKSVLAASASQVQEFQLNRIRELCRYAYEHTAFYRRRFDGIGVRSFDRFGLEEFQRMPPLTKADIRQDVAALVSREYSLAELRRSATGGTTSSPITIYMDWPAFHRRWAATHEWDRRIGYVRGQKIAYLWGARQDFSETTSWRAQFLNKYVTRARFLASSPLDDEIMGRYYETLKRWQPRFLQAYPTPLAIFSEFLLRNRLTLDIPAIAVTAEPLLQSQAEVITRAFGRQPYNWYGAREAGRIATECQFHSGMHLNAYGVYVEIDRRDEFDDSSLGRVLITDLWNYAMPLLRYDIGDVGAISTETCPCGSTLPRLTALDGRTTDVFVNAAGQRISGVAFTNRIVKDDAEIREMQVIQTAIGRFEVLVVPGQQWRGTPSERDVMSRVSEFMAEPTETTVSLVSSIPREKSGKVRFCKSLVADQLAN